MAYNPAPPDDPVRRRPDISLAQTKLQWEPKIPLREGLAKTMDYFRAELGLARP
jgi:nucleoside-diphosphate-sugar epimerase